MSDYTIKAGKRNLWADLYYMALKSGYNMRVRHIGNDVYKLWFYNSAGWTEGMQDPIGYKLSSGEIESLRWDYSVTMEDNWG